MLTQPAVPPAPKKRRHRRFLPILITILVLLGAAAAFFLHSDFKKDLEAYRLVEARVKEDPMTMDVTVDASYGKISLSADASVARTKKDGSTQTARSTLKTASPTLSAAHSQITPSSWMRPPSSAARSR